MRAPEVWALREEAVASLLSVVFWRAPTVRHNVWKVPGRIFGQIFPFLFSKCTSQTNKGRSEFSRYLWKWDYRLWHRQDFNFEMQHDLYFPCDCRQLAAIVIHKRWEQRLWDLKWVSDLSHLYWNNHIRRLIVSFPSPLHCRSWHQESFTLLFMSHGFESRVLRKNY